MGEFKYLNYVGLALAAANAREPRLQPSAIEEFGELMSHEVAAGDWLNDNGVAINAKGQTPEEYLDFLITNPERPRTHWEIPAAVIDEADDTWTSGSLSKQGARWKKLRQMLGSDAATDAAMKAEAELYGTKFGSTAPGTKPGEKSEGETKTPSGGPNNPWNVKGWRSTEAARLEKMASIIKQGTKFAASMAASAGVTITGAPLRK